MNVFKKWFSLLKPQLKSWIRVSVEARLRKLCLCPCPPLDNDQLATAFFNTFMLCPPLSNDQHSTDFFNPVMLYPASLGLVPPDLSPHFIHSHHTHPA